MFQIMNRVLTCPIFYLNAKPHIGHLYTMVLADAQKRFHQQRNQPSIKLSIGTDEHGTKVSQAASDAKKTPQKFCDGISKQFSLGHFSTIF